MIITRTPFRVSILGGSTDYPEAYKLYPGKVLGFALNKYSYVAINRRLSIGDFRTKIAYYELEKVNHYRDIKQPAVRATLEYLDDNSELDINHFSELPSQSGLGTSSSFIVGLYHALRRLNGNFALKQELAEASLYIEREILAEKTGAQDSYFASFGGFNTIQFSPELISVKPWTYGISELLIKNMLLMYIGGRRSSAAIASTYSFNEAKQINMVNLVDDGRTALVNEDIKGFGQVLAESWMQKKSYSKSITNKTIDEIISDLYNMGAYGAKLCGAGYSGCIAIVTPIELKNKIIQKFKQYKFIDLGIDWEGSKVIYETEEDIN